MQPTSDIPDAAVEAALRHLDQRAEGGRCEEMVREMLAAYEAALWRPIEEAPINDSVLIWLPQFEHYGPGIYRAIHVDMGTGRRWHVTAYAMGRDLDPRDWPQKWRPMPLPPESER